MRCCLGLYFGLALAAIPCLATDFTYIPIPVSNDIQTAIVSAFPTGVFVSNNSVGTPFIIGNATGICGPGGNAPCNFYDAFGTQGSGNSITINTSIPSPTDIYTLMNAYYPADGQQLATIQFVGSGGASVTFPLIAGRDIRDFYHYIYANDLTNDVPGVTTTNVFTCVSPGTCLGGAATFNVQTGYLGTYLIDGQDFSLGSTFSGQTLTKIVLTDTYNGSVPILLGVTAAAASPANSVATVNAASFAPGETVASDSIASVFGVDVANQTAFSGATLGDTLGGTSATITDSAGTKAPLPLFFVSAGQVNAQIPAGLATGPATISLTSGDGKVSAGQLTLTTIGPGIFASQNLALAYSLQVVNGAAQYALTVAPSTTTAGQFVASPIQLSSSVDTYLVLYGTGLRGATLSEVTVQIGSMLLTPVFSGPTGAFAGEDQVNVLIPASLAGSGDNAVIVTAAGEQANTVHITIK